MKKQRKLMKKIVRCHDIFRIDMDVLWNATQMAGCWSRLAEVREGHSIRMSVPLYWELVYTLATWLFRPELM
jgi:hypothetical protein